MHVQHADTDCTRDEKLAFEMMTRLIPEMEGQMLEHELRSYFSFSLDSELPEPKKRDKQLLSDHAEKTIFIMRTGFE